MALEHGPSILDYAVYYWLQYIKVMIGFMTGIVIPWLKTIRYLFTSHRMQKDDYLSGLSHGGWRFVCEDNAQYMNKNEG